MYITLCHLQRSLLQLICTCYSVSSKHGFHCRKIVFLSSSHPFATHITPTSSVIRVLKYSFSLGNKCKSKPDTYGGWHRIVHRLSVHDMICVQIISGNIRFVRTADVRAGSLEKRHQRTVESRINARQEHLFLAFENKCVKLNRDRPIV